MTRSATKPPPRHCTTCGARIWSLSTVVVHNGYSSARWRDRCNECTTDPADRDRWELFTTGRSTRRADR